MNYYERRGDEYIRTRQGLTPSELVRVRNQLSQNFSGQVTTPQITADQNNFSLPVGATLVRLDVDSTQRTITGFTGERSTRAITLRNVGGANILLAHDSASSVAENRILLPTPAGLLIPPGQTATIIYDLTTKRWVLIDERPSLTITLATLNADANDVALAAGGVIFRIQTDGNPRSVTGFSGGYAGRQVTFHCLGTGTVTFTHLDGASQAANRMLFPTVFGITLTPPQTLTLIYDGTEQRWIMVARTS